MAGTMQHGGPGQPHATEYTLQGVMRFLQTEWHRHERDRNAWEIERQEMRGRIATLEGQARRSDATQKALQKYVGILQNKVKEQAEQLQGVPHAAEPEHKDVADKDDRAAKIRDRLKGSSKTHDGTDSELVEDDAQRLELKTFLEQCQTEFSYLMITPANPLPPRESPALPLDDIRDTDAMNIMGGQPLFSGNRFQQGPVEMPQRQPHHQGGHNAQQQQQQQQLMVRNSGLPQQEHSRSNDHLQSPFGSENDWDSRSIEEPVPRHANGDGPEREIEGSGRTETPIDDGWNLDFPRPGSAPAQPTTNRPDTDAFPSAEPPKSPSRSPISHRRHGSVSRRRSVDHELSLNSSNHHKSEGEFRLRYGLRGHLNTVRTVIFSGGGSPGEPEVCTAGDDGTVKRFLIPRLDNHSVLGMTDADVQANFTHRGHTGAVLSLASWSPSPNFATGGRAQGDGWIFSGGQDATIRVWERGRVDPKATLDGHTDAVWALCVLPATLGSVFGQTNSIGPADRILFVSGSADATVRLWAISAPPQLTSPQPGTGSMRLPGGRGRVRGNSMSSGSAFPATPQPSIASNSPFNSSLVHTITRQDGSTASPTAISPLSPSGETFIVSYSDAAVLVFDTRSGEQIGAMTSVETYDGTMDTAVNAVAATTVGFEQAAQAAAGGGNEDENAQQRAGAGPTGGGRSMAGSGVEGTIISGHEDQVIRFYDANSGQCTYSMVAHPSSVSSLSLSPDGRELVSTGHDASLRFWNLEKRSCTHVIHTHRIMRGEGICDVVWSHDGRWVVSGGGDGIVKVFAR